MESSARRSVDSGLNYVAAVGALFWIGVAIQHYFGPETLSSFVGLCVALLAVYVVVCLTSDAIRDFREQLPPRTGAGQRPAVTLSQELSDEKLLEQLVTECEQRLHLIPADPLFASRLDTCAVVEPGQGSAT